MIGDTYIHNSASVSCGSNLATGLRGQKGGVINQLGFHCASADQALAGTFQPALGVPVGGTGGSAAEQACPLGQVATGVKVGVITLAYGEHIRGIDVVCTDLVDDRDVGGGVSIGSDKSLVSFFGGHDTVEHTCQDGWAISRTDVLYGRSWDNSYSDSLTGVSFACAPILPDGTLDTSNLDSSSVVGDSAAFTPGAASCDGRFVTGLRGQKGGVLDQLGLICSTGDQVDSGLWDPAFGTPVGGAGGTYAESGCPTGFIGTGVKMSFITLSYGEHINRVELVCTPKPTS
jgi:hypothetical protein